MQLDGTVIDETIVRALNALGVKYTPLGFNGFPSTESLVRALEQIDAKGRAPYVLQYNGTVVDESAIRLINKLRDGN